MIGPAGERREPVRWWNGCNETVPKALRYLANYERPSGGEQRFNAIHLLQLAEEIEDMAAKKLYEVTPEVAALQSTIAQLQARVAELESGRAGGIWFPREQGDELAELLAEKAKVCGGGAFDIWEEICERFGNAPPTPVAMAPSTEQFCEAFVSSGYVDEVQAEDLAGIATRACLDATAALNEERAVKNIGTFTKWIRKTCGACGHSTRFEQKGPMVIRPTDCCEKCSSRALHFTGEKE